MIARHMPLVLGALLILVAISVTAIALRLIGVPRAAALYFACLAVFVGLHFLSRRLLRKG